MVDDGPNPFWQHLADFDLGEIRKGRDRMKMALARYGRQPLDYWDDKDVAELTYWHKLLKDLVEGEGATQSITED